MSHVRQVYKMISTSLARSYFHLPLHFNISAYNVMNVAYTCMFTMYATFYDVCQGQVI